jgi:hypothetical protein
MDVRLILPELLMFVNLPELAQAAVTIVVEVLVKMLITYIIALVREPIQHSIKHVVSMGARQTLPAHQMPASLQVHVLVVVGIAVVV